MGQVMTGAGLEDVAQATVKINLEQFLGMKTEGASDPKNFHPGGPEYIVIEKWMSRPEEPWKIAGKIEN
jgi:hypothetical protein